MGLAGYYYKVVCNMYIFFFHLHAHKLIGDYSFITTHIPNTPPAVIFLHAIPVSSSVSGSPSPPHVILTPHAHILFPTNQLPLQLHLLLNNTHSAEVFAASNRAHHVFF
jgi:hypothetical protein